MNEDCTPNEFTLLKRAGVLVVRGESIRISDVVLKPIFWCL